MKTFMVWTYRILLTVAFIMFVPVMLFVVLGIGFSNAPDHLQPDGTTAAMSLFLLFPAIPIAMLGSIIFLLTTPYRKNYKPYKETKFFKFIRIAILVSLIPLTVLFVIG